METGETAGQQFLSATEVGVKEKIGIKKVSDERDQEMRSLMRRLLLIFLAIVLTGVASGLLGGCKQKKSSSEPAKKSTPAEEKEDINVEEW